MNNKEAAEILKTDCCSECSYQTESAVTCKATKCNYKKAVEVAITALDNSEADRWIPVSERLPEEEGDYLAQIDNKQNEQLTMHFSKEYGFYFMGCVITDVIAWRPLPEPYKESEATE